MSRKPWITAGSVMRERHNPKPKRNPVSNPAIVSRMAASQKVADDKDSGHSGGDERRGRDNRARGHARNTADAVTRRATATERRADAHKQARGDEHDGSDGRSADAVVAGQDRQQRRREHQAEDEGDPPGAVVSRLRRQEAADDAADAGDAAGERHQQNGGDSDQATADESEYIRMHREHL